jgi:hypothetical protein
VDYSGGNTNSVAKWCCWLLVACRRSGGRQVQRMAGNREISFKICSEPKAWQRRGPFCDPTTSRCALWLSVGGSPPSSKFHVPTRVC